MFNEHQIRLWKHMIEFIDSFNKDNISFSKLVGELHGALQAGDFNKDLVNKWYNLWGDLEIYNAVKLDTGEPVIKEEVMKYVKAMREFLIEQLKKNAIK